MSFRLTTFILIFMALTINISAQEALRFTESAMYQNPFFIDWDTPFGVPPFDLIRNDHYLPAYQEAIKQHDLEIAAIVADKATPGFDNTVAALDRAGALLEKVSAVFNGLNGANTNKEMQEIARQISPLVTRHGDDINMNPALFARIKSVYNKRTSLELQPDQLRLLEEMYRNFIRGGAGLDPKSQQKLRDLNTEINMLQLSFGQNLLAETNGYSLWIEQEGDLAGLPAELVKASAATPSDSGKTGWQFGLQNPSVIPFLQYAENRGLREKMFTAYISRGNNNNKEDNKELVGKLVNLRLEKAKLLGYKTFADFILAERMAKKPEKVYDLLNKLWPASLAKAEMELSMMQVMLKNDYPDASFEGWDWRYYSEKVRKEKYRLDEEVLKPYFMLDNVLKGVFVLSEKLYGISFKLVENAPVYEESVKLYECLDRDGSHLGVLYLDFHPRSGKRGGAWCGSYRPQGYRDGKRIPPVVTIVCNFTPPSKEMPSLLTPDETETLFHEFGHALHGLFKDVKYKGLASVPRDFVELPSQIMEHWVFEPALLKEYAFHYETKEPIPGDLVNKLLESSKYGEGFKTSEYLAAAYLDMDYHTLSVPEKVDVPKFEQLSMKKIGLLPQIPPRYKSTYFQHSMTGGYTAGYYSYIWSEVLDSDAYEAFRETGNIFNPDVAEAFRKKILEKGGSRDAREMYLDFRGREPGIEFLLKNRGLAD